MKTVPGTVPKPSVPTPKATKNPVHTTVTGTSNASAGAKTRPASGRPRHSTRSPGCNHGVVPRPPSPPSTHPMDVAG